jgi:peptidoglycan-associated lipoprotein
LEEKEVNSKRRNSVLLALALSTLLVLGACKKKVAPPPAPPPPPPAAPTASLSANPASIQKGQSTVLAWQTSNATDVTIEGVGPVGPSGTQSVSPADSTTYRLTAKGAGGNQEATTRVTVTQPPPPPATPTPSDAQQFAANVRDIYFDYDKYDVRPDQQATIQANARWLAAHPNVSFTVGGYCDDRGSTEYNLALGENRANAAKQALVQAGIAANRIKTISYGKEKPFCTEQTEACWQQNRRAQFVYGQ